MTKRNNLPLVSIIIVNWNGGEVFGECLKSLLKINYPNWNLIVVDNASTDGSEKLPTKYKLKHNLVVNKLNLGFAPANNIGLEFSKGEYVLLLNNDTIVSPDFLSKMVNRMELDGTIGVMQPKLFMMDKKGYLDNTGSFLTKTGFLEHWGYGEKDRSEFDNEREIFSAKGACLLTRREIINKVGLFDGDFVSYFEESDYCWRVWLAGWRVMYFPNASILHKVGFTSKKLIPIDVNYHSMKNRIASLFRNLELKSLFTILVPHLILVSLLGLYYLLRFQFSKFFMIFKSIFWNILNINNNLINRHKIQKIRTVSDSELFARTLHPINWKLMLSHFVHTEGNFKRHDDKYSLEIPIAGRVRICLEMIKNEKLKNKVVANIGCSFGWMESVLAGLNAKKIYGVDPDEKAVDYAKKHVLGASFFVGEAGNIPLDDKSVDVVSLFDVIEHVPMNSEQQVLHEIKRILKHNGVLLLSTPNSNFLTNILDPAWYIGHRHYNLMNLRKLIENSGFKVQSCETKGSLWFSIYLGWLYVMKWVFKVKNPRFKILERIDDKSFNAKGIHTIFIKAIKVN